MGKYFSLLYHNSLTMIYLMLDDLCRPSAIFLSLFFEIHILIFYFYLLISGACSHTSKRKTAFFRLIFSGTFYDLRIEHCYVHEAHIDSYNAFLHPDHIGCHADTALFVCLQCV